MLPEFRLSQQPTAQPLTGNEYVYVVQNGQTVKALVNQFGSQGFPQSFITTIGENGTLAGGRTIGAGSAITMIDNGAGNQFVIGVTSNPVIPGTAGMIVPTGTTAQQNPVNGQIRYNSDTGKFEFYQNNTFIGLSSQGTVSSVSVSLPGIFSVTGNPITTSGTITANLAPQSANIVFAGPSSGGAASPTFRSLVGADLPTPGLSALGGIQATDGTVHQWISSISIAGVPQLSQPSTSDISGLGTIATQSASAVNITGGTITGMPNPTGSTDVATKSYVDGVTTGLTLKASCRVATTSNLTATYNNGTAGVGATLTNSGAQAALTIDGVALSLNDRVLVKDQSTQANNGIYTVTTVGTGASNWVLTRATDYNQSSNIVVGSYTIITAGTTNIGTMWIESGIGPFTVGSTALIFTALNVGAVVTSVGLSLPSFITVTNSPVTNAGTLTGTLANQTANLVFSGPSTGSAAAPTFRALVVGDMPGLGTIATQSAGAVAITGGTITGMPNPTGSTDVANKAYVDSNTSLSSLRSSCRATTTVNLSATYDNGSSGVGATLTNSGTQVALVIDGVTMIVGDRVIIKNQATQANNGIYTVTDTGSISTNWILTRATDFNTPSNIIEGAFTMVSEGDANAGCLYIQITPAPITVGITSIVFLQNGASGVGGLVSPNLVYAGPTLGAPSSPSFRSLMGTDLPNPTTGSLGGVQAVTAVTNQWITSITTAGVPVLAQPAFTDIAGSIAATQLPNPSSTTLGGIQSASAVSHQWINSISTSGVPVLSQPAFTDLAGVIQSSQLNLGIEMAWSGTKVISTFEYFDYNSTVIPARGDCTATLQQFINTCYLTAISNNAIALSDQGTRTVVRAKAIGSAPLVTKCPIINLPFVDMDFDTMITRYYDGTGTITNFYNGDTTTKALENQCQPTVILPPLSHGSHISIFCNPDGVHQGSGLYAGRAWIMAGGGSIGVAGNGGYLVGDVITLVNPHKAPYKGATYSVTTIDGLGNPTSLTFIQGGVWPAPPKILRSLWTDSRYTTAVAAGYAASVFDAGGNYKTTGGNGSGLTITVPDTTSGWVADFSGGSCTQDFSAYQLGGMILGHIYVEAAGTNLDSTYGPVRAFFITSLDIFIGDVVSQGGYYGNVIYSTDTLIGNTVYNVGAKKCQFVKFAGGNLHGRIECDTPAAPNGYYFDIDHFTGSKFEVYCFNNGVSALTGLTYAGFIGGKNISSGDTNQVAACELDINFWNGGNAAGLPAVFIDYCASTNIRINVSNRANKAASAYPNNKLAVLGTHNGIGNLLSGQIDSVAGAIVTGIFTGWGINIRDDSIGGWMGDNGIYTIYGSGVPANGSSGTGVNKAPINSKYNDQTNGNTYINMGTSTSLLWIPQALINRIPAGQQVVVNSATSPYTVLATDYEILVDTSGGAVQLNLPSPATRYRFKVKDIGGAFGTNNCTIHRNAAENIEGLAADLVLRANYGNYEFQSDGTNWWKMSASCNWAKITISTAGTTSWTAPGGVTNIMTLGRGGSGGGAGGSGGGGGSTTTAACGGGAGGNGGTCIKTPQSLNVVPGSVYSLVVGAGGTGGTSGAGAVANASGATGTVGGAATAGGTTSFGSLFQWLGSAAGTVGTAGSLASAGTAGGAGGGVYNLTASGAGAGGAANTAGSNGGGANTTRYPYYTIGSVSPTGGTAGGANGGGGGGAQACNVPGDGAAAANVSGGNGGAAGIDGHAPLSGGANGTNGQGGAGGGGGGGGGVLATVGTNGGAGGAGGNGSDGILEFMWQE